MLGVVPYKAEIAVGTSGDYKTIGEALDAVRHMTRDNGERVVIAIEAFISNMTNKFSTYAIAYIDGEVENLPVVDDNAPVVDEQPVVNDVVEESGSSMGMIAVIAVLLLALPGLVLCRNQSTDFR